MTSSASRQDASRLYQWIARASFPEERIKSGAFTFSAEQDAVVLQNRCDSWSALFRPAPEGGEILRRRGLDQQQWYQSMRDVDVSAPEYLPDWAKTFIDLYERWRQHDERIKPEYAEKKPHLTLAVAWAELCRPWLNAQQHQLASAGIQLTEASVNDLLENLMSRLAPPLFGVLNAYPGSFPEGEDDYRQQLFETLGFWQAAFERQPILVKIIGNLVFRWQIATEEMLHRFTADLSQLTVQMLRPQAQTDDGIVVSRLRCGLGDPHRGGRSVAIFETSRGDVVYKPKNLIGTWAIGLLLQDLHPSHSEFVPLTPAFMYCQGYGWEQRVRWQACGQLSEVETFYRRLGGWLFVLQLLNGNDFWYDNLIACADMPYFIDYETIVGNSFEDLWNTDEQDEHVVQFRKMQMVGMLPLLMPGSVSFKLADGIDISVTTPPGKQQVPFSKKDNLYDDFEASDYAPFYQGEFQDMNDFLEIFIDGYRRMGKLLESDIGREALQQFYQRIDQARFRHIVVDTWQCYSLIARFFGDCGNDGVRASIALDRFFSIFKGFPITIIDGIRNDIWNNDVPLFELQTNSLLLFNTANVATEENFFKKTTLSKIARNYAYSLNETDRQISYIKALFSTRPDNPRRPWRRSNDVSNASQSVTDGEFVALAQEIGNQLASNINQTENLKDYLAIGRLQLNNIRIPQRLLLNFDGCSGIIVFLATLQQYAAPKNDNIKALRKCYEYMTGDAIEGFEYETAKTYGVISLHGSKLAALCSLARVKPAMNNNLTANVEHLTVDLLKEMRDTDSLFVDYRHGISGLLYRFTELELLFNNEILTPWIEQILELIETKSLQASPEQTDTYRKYANAFLPNATSGMYLVNQYMQDNWPLFVEHPGYLKLRNFIADLQEEKARNASGEHHTGGMPEQQAHEYTAKQLLTKSGEFLMDHLYQLLAVPGVNSPREAVDNLVNEIVQRKRSSQCWFPDCWADDNFRVGAIHGQADMGLLLLSVHARKNLNPFRAPLIPSADMA